MKWSERREHGDGGYSGTLAALPTQSKSTYAALSAKGTASDGTTDTFPVVRTVDQNGNVTVLPMGGRQGGAARTLIDAPHEAWTYPSPLRGRRSQLESPRLSFCAVGG